MLNLTRQEKLVIEFLVLFFLIGSGIRLYRERIRPQSTPSRTEIQEFKALAQKSDSVYIAKHGKQSASKSKKIKREVKREGKINLNRATKQELMSLPRIGTTIADSIIAYRTKHGGFKDIEELKKVKGIGTKTFEILKGEVSIE